VTQTAYQERHCHANKRHPDGETVLGILSGIVLILSLAVFAFLLVPLIVG
jgi:hypothetical protein